MLEEIRFDGIIGLGVIYISISLRFVWIRDRVFVIIKMDRTLSLG